MKKLLLLLLMIPTISFAESDSEYYGKWIEGECIKQSYMAKNDFVAKKIYERCEKAAMGCIFDAKQEVKFYTQRAIYLSCMRDEIGWKGTNSPKFSAPLPKKMTDEDDPHGVNEIIDNWFKD